MTFPTSSIAANDSQGVERCLPDGDLKAQVAAHIDACRRRIPTFVAANYGGRGALGLNRHAIGTDVLVAPFNFLMGLPNFLLRVLAAIFDLIGARQMAQRLARNHLGLRTAVHKTLRARLMRDLLDLSGPPGEACDGVRKRLSDAAQEPVRIYLQTRNVAADITAGTLAAIMGVAFLHQFTPGSISAGSALAHVIAKEQAVSQFALGETLGRLYYAVFPISPSLPVIGLSLLGVMAMIAVVTAFSGVIHDPIQAAAGIHRRRLNRMLDAIEALATEPFAKGYRPKDTYLGRVYDLIDWVKGALSL